MWFFNSWRIWGAACQGLGGGIGCESLTETSIMDKKDRDRLKARYVGLGISMGAGLGAAFGVAMHNIAVGVALGPGIGLAIAMGMLAARLKKDE